MNTALQLSPTALSKAHKAFRVFEILLSSIAEAKPNGSAQSDELKPLLCLIRTALASATPPSPTHPTPRLRLVK